MSPRSEAAAARRVRCREIRAEDADAVVDLLARGFTTRPREFWTRALARLAAHPTPPAYPKFGYLMEKSGTPVGVILLIFSAVGHGPEMAVRCSVSSWYVEPAYRGFATMLTAHALRHNGATYVDITPDPHTWPILKAQGWQQFCAGRFIAVPTLSGGSGAEVRRVTGRTRLDHLLPAAEAELLRHHAEYGCLTTLCISGSEVAPFIFLPLRLMRVLPSAYLAYCRQVDDFARFARPLGRFLAKSGVFFVELDSDGPVPRLVGRYLGGAPKFYRGPERPALGDIAYSERVMFGF
ncbi:MAG TPA: hypothetical protein VFX06_03065 [Stellaceae bacterium]|nr:hypothetical protein [Stellaceae bacterium]